MDYILNSESFQNAQRFYEDNHIPAAELQPMGAADIETIDLVDGEYKNLRLAVDKFREDWEGEIYDQVGCWRKYLEPKDEDLEWYKNECVLLERQNNKLIDCLYDNEKHTHFQAFEDMWVRDKQDALKFRKSTAELKAENEKLKADVERLEKQRDTEREMHAEFNKWVVEHIDKNVGELQAENEELKAENDILQNYRKMMDKIEILTDEYVESGDFNGVPPYIEKLQAENERLHRDVECRAKQLEIYLSMIEKYKAQIADVN